MLKFQNNLPRITAKCVQQISLRNIWGYVAIAFNRVDTDRLKLVGPDRLCTEWLLKNSGAVRAMEMPGWLKDYNALPPESMKFRVKEVDASGASIMKIGLEHFRGCRFIDTVILHECKHLEEDALVGLLHVKDTLRHLQVSGCYNIAAEGLKPLGELKRLETLKIFDMTYVKNLDAVVRELQGQLPQCKIDAQK